MIAGLVAVWRGINGMLSFVPAAVWAALLAGASLHSCAIGLQRDHAKNNLHDLEAKVARADAARAEVALAANSNFRKYEHQQAVQAMELENANQKRKAAALVADDHARAADDRLRSTVDDLNATARARAMSGTAACADQSAASRREAEGARAVLAACSAEYRALGRAAALDGLDLDTALDYVDLVQTPAP